MCTIDLVLSSVCPDYSRLSLTKYNTNTIKYKNQKSKLKRQSGPIGSWRGQQLQTDNTRTCQIIQNLIPVDIKSLEGIRINGHLVMNRHPCTAVSDKIARIKRSGHLFGRVSLLPLHRFLSAGWLFWSWREQVDLRIWQLQRFFF
jgi:hypothetical protein